MLQITKIRYQQTADRHMKKALRKYRTGPLVTICDKYELPALLEDGWELVGTHTVAVGSIRHTLQHAR